MAEVKTKKKKFLSVWLPIIIGFVIGFSIVIGWSVYIATLPKLDEQLKFSPFYVDGKWVCEGEDFTITSEGGEVTGVFEKDQSYTLRFNFRATRGFNHKYAAYIIITCDNPEMEYTCYYEFGENQFVLKAFEYKTGNEPFKEITELTFVKQ